MVRVFGYLMLGFLGEGGGVEGREGVLLFSCIKPKFDKFFVCLSVNAKAHFLLENQKTAAYWL